MRIIETYSVFAGLPHDGVQEEGLAEADPAAHRHNPHWRVDELQNGQCLEIELENVLAVPIVHDANQLDRLSLGGNVLHCVRVPLTESVDHLVHVLLVLPVRTTEAYTLFSFDLSHVRAVVCRRGGQAILKSS